LGRVFERLQQAQILRIKIEAVSLDKHFDQGASRRHGGIKKTALSPWVNLAAEGTHQNSSGCRE
jgi:hypothetical protein